MAEAYDLILKVGRVLRKGDGVYGRASVREKEDLGVAKKEEDLKEEN